MQKSLMILSFEWLVTIKICDGDTPRSTSEFITLMVVSSLCMGSYAELKD